MINTISPFLEPVQSPTQRHTHNMSIFYVGDEQEEDEEIQLVGQHTSRDKEHQAMLAVERPLRESSSYYEQDLDPELELARHARTRIFRQCSAFALNHARENEKRCETDFFYALFFNYEACDMDQDLESTIAYVLNRYKPLSKPPTEEELRDHRFVSSALRLVLKNKSSEMIPIKIYLFLMLVSLEEDLIKQLTQRCPSSRILQFLPGLKGLGDQRLKSHFTRCSIRQQVQDSIVFAATMYTMKNYPIL